MFIRMATTPASPKPAPHHGYKSWTTSWYDRKGKRHFKRFGKCDEVTRKEALARYNNWMGREFLTRGSVQGDEWTVQRLCGAYFDECKKIYMKDGEQTSTLDNAKIGLQQLIDAYGDLDANDFDSPMLTKLAKEMCYSKRKDGSARTLSIGTVNSRVQTIRRMYVWARSHGWVSREAALDINATPLLRAGRCDAKPMRIVESVPAEVLAATLAKAPKTVADMVQLQILTGMRSGEVCQMRTVDIDRSGKVWIYSPRKHKMQHRRKIRVIAIGPRAQAILTPYIERRANIADPVFLAAEAHRERLELSGSPEWRAYQLSRSHFRPSRAFRADTYLNRIYQACDHAFDSDGEKRKAKDYSHRWHPHQLRHNAATVTRAELGSEAAQDMLGHSQMSTTMIYAERTVERLKEIALKVG